MYELGIQLNDPDSIHNMAWLYENGEEGLEVNIEKAVELYNKAINLGNSNSMHNLGLIYEIGKPNFPKNINKGIFF